MNQLLQTVIKFECASTRNGQFTSYSMEKKQSFFFVYILQLVQIYCRVGRPSFFLNYVFKKLTSETILNDYFFDHFRKMHPTDNSIPAIAFVRHTRRIAVRRKKKRDQASQHLTTDRQSALLRLLGISHTSSIDRRSVHHPAAIGKTRRTYSSLRHHGDVKIRINRCTYNNLQIQK